MSGIDHALVLRKAVIRKLRANAAVTALVGDRVFDTVPAGAKRPYLRYGVPIIGPFEATGIVGSDIDVTIHVFDEGADADRMHQIMRSIVAVLDEKPLVLDEGFLLWITWTGSQPLTDEATRQYHHGIVEFNAVTGADPA